MSEMDSNFSEDSIARAHRIGPKIVSKNWTVQQKMIIRFKTFSDRTKFYGSCKKTKEVSIRLDLTKKHSTLLKVARDKLKDMEGVDFAFTDINFYLSLRLSSGELSLFRTEAEHTSENLIVRFFHFSSCKPASLGGVM